MPQKGLRTPEKTQNVEYSLTTPDHLLVLVLTTLVLPIRDFWVKPPHEVGRTREKAKEASGQA